MHWHHKMWLHQEKGLRDCLICISLKEIIEIDWRSYASWGFLAKSNLISHSSFILLAQMIEKSVKFCVWSPSKTAPLHHTTIDQFYSKSRIIAVNILYENAIKQFFKS